MTAHLITCRYGKTYSVRLEGRNAEKIRAILMLQECCCWVCYNRSCAQPKNEILPDCQNVCKLFFKKAPCGIEQEDKQ